MKLRKITAVLAAALLTMTAMTACSGGAASSASSETPSSESSAASAESTSSEETTGGDMTGEITVLSREDGSGTRGAFIELFGIEQKNDAGEKEDMTTDDAQITNSTSVMMTTVQKYNAQKTADLLKAVYEFVEQTQRCFCESICQRERYQDSPCPVKQLVEFINWLEKELDVLCQAPKRNGSVDGNRDESMANHWDKHH